MSKTVSTRMAPSPTGEFHIGGIRTLLYNWALAKKNNGRFIIRIEDTDRARLVEGATERLLEVIRDYGFTWDEGPEVGGPHAPYIQSERLPLYKKYSEQLISEGKAYYCFCTSERLEKMRDEQKLKGITSTKYDRHCSTLTPSEVADKLSTNTPFVVRLKVPSGKEITWNDVVLGKVSFQSDEIDDQILLKSDGFPTYHLAVVVDDHEMEITHVMRGNEWLPSTPKHILLYEAFGWEQPIYAHLPNLKEVGGTKKLSKRHGPVAARGFLDEGYLPEALVNYLMFLGWNPGGEKEIYSLDEFSHEFSIEKIHKSDLVSFDRQKLDWFNTQYIKEKTDTELAQMLIKFSPQCQDVEMLSKIAPLVKERMKKLSEFSELTAFFFSAVEIDKTLFSSEYTSHVSKSIEAISEMETFDIVKIGEVLQKVVGDNSFKPRDYFMDLRIAVTGKKISPPLNESMAILGKEKVLERLANASS